MLSLQLKNQIREYVQRQPLNEESGGLLVESNENIIFFPCKNLSYHRDKHYILSALDYLKAEGFGKIIAQVHSQENDGPSILDNISAYNYNLYSITYCWKSDKFYVVNPKLKDYLHKDFEIGKNDCFSLVREYYKNELNIDINNYSREENWYLKVPTIMYDNFFNEGFIITESNNWELHDILLFGNNLRELNHMGIYQGNNLMLHMPRNGKSLIEDINIHWLNKLQLKLTHKQLLKNV